MIGRTLALIKHKCPKELYGVNKYNGKLMVCADCPSGCPLNEPDCSRNDPNRHPEYFIDGYSYMYPLEGVDESVLTYETGPDKYGYYLKEIPEHWDEFVKLIDKYGK